MKNTKKLFTGSMIALLAAGTLAGCGPKSGEDVYDKDGRLILNLKNVYFDTWEGEDVYTEEINKKFNVKIKASNYDYNDWDGNVYTAISGNNLGDAIHFNLKAYNFGTTYEEWVDDQIIKALPDDATMASKWPNLKRVLDNVSNIDKLKIDGKLYCIPISNDISNPNKDFSNFTYVYRRDWAKQIDENNKDKAGYTPIYKEGDVYTWEEFNRLVDAFKTNVKALSGGVEKATAIVDERWGFPSVTNFYKDVPHCYAKDATGKAINAFTSDKYIEGLEVAKTFVKNGIYSGDQYNFKDTYATKQYETGLAGILYDNYSLANYITLRREFKRNNKFVDLDDGTAFLKVKGPDGKFALEGTENWFSATMFNYDISEQKMERILDIIDWLLTDEGTKFAIYGIKDYDYTIEDGEVVLSPTGWEKGADGKYGNKPNGGKYLRYMATLGNDTKSFDPYTDMDAFEIVNNWITEMKAAKEAGQLRVVKEPADIDWMTTPTKNEKTEDLLSAANVSATKYAFDAIKTIDNYKKEFNTSFWQRVLEEINQKLGK